MDLPRVSRVRNPLSTEAGDAPARMARREEREYQEYLSDEQRSQPGCSAGRMPTDF
jgi:hypothetical protein